jgi:hypothetical protein
VPDRDPKTAAPGPPPDVPGAALTPAADEWPPCSDAAAEGGKRASQVAVPPPAHPHGGRGGTVTPLTGKEWRDAYRRAQSSLHCAQRNKRGKRPGPPITGIRWGGPQ